MKKKLLISALLLFQVTVTAVADQGTAAPAAEQPAIGFWDVLPEAILRPVGAMSVAGGMALFLAATPFTAIASIEPPHDAMSHSFNGFVGGPVRYTFTRPIGVYAFEVYPE